MPDSAGDALTIYRALSRLARGHGEDFQLVLRRFALERLLYRIGRSPHADALVLKGAMLFQVWMRQPHRPTQDLDFLGYGDSSIARFEAMLREVCAISGGGDGIQFLPETVSGRVMKAGERYEVCGGARMHGSRRRRSPFISISASATR